MYYCNPFSTSNNIVSPVDVGGFAEPRKILCLSVLTPPLSRDQYITGRRIPPNKYWIHTQIISIYKAYSKDSCYKCYFKLFSGIKSTLKTYFLGLLYCPESPWITCSKPLAIIIALFINI